jgi:short-subunit dehydrogenase
MSRPVALITGASSGIGETFARKLAARGFDLILIARRAERLEQVARELPHPANENAIVLPADLTTEEGMHAACHAIADAPRLEILVNNAGFGTIGRFWQADLEGQEAMHRLHVLATVRLTYAALSGMTTRGRGSVVNVSSVAAFGLSDGNVSYCATKAWMNSFTQSLAMELRNAGSPVRVQALCPGFTVTEFHQTLGVNPGEIPSYLWMTSDEIVETSLRALERNKVVVIPGWKYKLAVAFLQSIPYAIRSRLRRPGQARRA